MKRYLFYMVKYVRWIYSLYFYVGSFILRLLGLFVTTDNKRILFISFGGRKYDDSPKAIYEEMLNDSRFDGCEFIWAFNNPDDFEIPKGRKIKTDTLSYFLAALRARIWVTNSTVERGLSFKKKNTFYFNTWHGTPLKKMGGDIASSSKSFKGKGEAQYDVFTVQGKYEADIFLKSFRLQQASIQLIGLPRNDVFANYSESKRQLIREKLNIGVDKKVILYAPTFREYESGEGFERVLSIPMSLDKWQSVLGDEYVLLFRAHYEVAKSMEIKDNEFVRDMSSYPQLDDLMIASDVLISDYSSMLFDYSIMHKPMLCFAYDYERYAAERGMYFDIRDYLPTAIDEDALLALIREVDFSKASDYTVAFQKKFVTSYGRAAKLSADLIYDRAIVHS